MEFIVGITLALFIGGAAAGLGMDRDRVFYPAVLMVRLDRKRDSRSRALGDGLLLVQLLAGWDQS